MPDPHAQQVFSTVLCYLAPVFGALVPVVSVFIMNYNIVFWNDPIRDWETGRPRWREESRKRWEVVMDKISRGCLILMTGMFWSSYSILGGMLLPMALGLAQPGTPGHPPVFSPDALFVWGLFSLLYGGYPFYLSRKQARADWVKTHGGA